jgi:hypothetical protein
MADQIPIMFKNPRVQTLAGNAFANVINVGNIDIEVMEFLADVEGRFYGLAHIPSGYGTVTSAVVVFDIIANATTGVTRMQVGTKEVGDAESINVTLTNITAQDITVPGTAWLTKKVSFTIVTEPVADDLLVVEFHHDGDHANDTLAVNTQILNAYLELT